MIKLQAAYGVGTEYPANSLTAFLAAAEQNYDSIYIEPELSSSGHFQARNTDFSKYERPKFSGTTVASIRETLELCREQGLTVRIGASFETFSEEKQEEFLQLIAPFRELTELTFSQAETLQMLHQRFPSMPLHYQGPVEQDLLPAFAQTIPSSLLTVWFDYHHTKTKDHAKLAALIKTCGQLGISSICEYNQFDEALALGATVISTPGQIKPVQNQGILSDMHTHSQNSMDANVPILDLAKAEIEAGAGIVAITDHCEMQWLDTWPEFDIDGCFLGADREIKEVQKELGDAIDIYLGMELGQAAWHPKEANRLIHLLPYDIIVGCVHEIMDPTIEDRVASITPWQSFFKPGYEPKRELFLKQYFQEILTLVKTVDMDTLAHMTFITRTARTRYGFHVDLHSYEDVIREILQIMIEKGIALEINCGWSLKRGFFDPQKWIVELYRQMGGYLITMGSDAHDAPDPPMAGFRETADQLKEMGFRNIFYFKGRRCYPCTI